MSFAAKLQEAFREMERYVIGWDEILNQAMYGLCTAEHLFWIGEPGRAKTWVAKLIFSLFPDAKNFSIQVTKDMMPSAIFGNEIPDEYLKTGREIINLDGGICTAELAYLDEFLDGPDFLVRSMNTVLNERRFERKDMRVEVPLHIAIATTNFDRYGQALKAVRDRMMCKAIIPRVNTLTGRLSMYNSYLNYAGSVPPLPKLSFEELKQFSDTIESPTGVVVPPEVRLLHAFLVHSYSVRRVKRQTEKFQQAHPNQTPTADDLGLEEVTPRTEARLHDFSRAAALLDGRTDVRCSDLKVMRYGLLTMGAGDGDEEAWTQVCDDFIPTSRKDIERLQTLADITGKLAELRMRRGDWTDIVVQAAGKAHTYTKITLLQFLDKLSADGKVVSAVATMLKEEVSSLGGEPMTAKK